MEDELTEKLYDLINDIEQKVDEEKENLPEVDIEYSKFEFEKYDYELFIEGYFSENDPEEPPFKLNQEKITESEISKDVVNDKIISNIENEEIYDDVIELVRGRLPNNIVQDSTNVSEQLLNESENIVGTFIQKTVDDILNNSRDEIPSREKTSLISALTRETSDSESCYETTVWIGRLGSDFEEVELNDQTKLLRPKREDLAQKTRSDVGIMSRMGPYLPPTLAINHKFWADGFPELQDEFETILSLIRLYSGSSAILLGYEIRPQSILKDNFKQWVDNPGQNPLWRGILDEEESSNIVDFYNVIDTPFRKYIFNGENKNYISISFDRFENAVVYDETIEEAIASTIMCLEALYLKENEKAELSERLAQRTGALLGYFDYEPIEVYDRIKAGYEIRSSYVHGTKSSEDLSNNIGRRTLSFARQSIILHLQLIDEYKKEKLISKLDNAIMSKKARNDFEDEVRQICEYHPTTHDW